jgi:hypothetical protein
MAGATEPPKANIRKYSDSAIKFSFIYSPVSLDRVLRTMYINSAILQRAEKYREKWSAEIHANDLGKLMRVFGDGFTSTSMDGAADRAQWRPRGEHKEKNGFHNASPL